jgi:hypothetical protein
MAATLTDDQIAGYAAGAGFSGDDIRIAVAIAKAESGGNPGAKNDTMNRNGSIDYGLFQINSVHASLLAGKDWADPAQNAAMAFSVFRDAGSKWTPWATFNSGSYQRYMTGPLTPAVPGAPGGAAAGTTTGAASWFSIPGLTDLITGMSGVIKAVTWLTLPTTWVRIICGLLGSILLFIGITALLREVRK